MIDKSKEEEQREPLEELEFRLTDESFIRESILRLSVDGPALPSFSRPVVLKRTPSVAFHEGETKTLIKVLNQIDSISTDKYQSGFNEVNFTMGVMNVLFISVAFGSIPQHFWLIYLVQSCYLLPRKIYTSLYTKPLVETLYLLDFCWVMNFLGVFLFLIFGLEYSSFLKVLPSISFETRKQVLMACYGIACGPLLGANIMLPFVAMIFHDVVTMTNLFIHIFPPLLMYTIRWHGLEVMQAWPGLFLHANHFQFVEFFDLKLGSIFGNTVLTYLCWFVPYVFWMLAIGLDLPRKHRKSGKSPKYDTVFHTWMRGGASYGIGKLWGRPASVTKKQIEESNFEVRDFLVYMLGHFISALSAIAVLGYACFYSRRLHQLLLMFIAFLSVYRGAMRYTYYTTKMYGHLIRKEFDLSADNKKDD